MQPSPIRLTFRPVRPNRVYSTSMSFPAKAVQYLCCPEDELTSDVAGFDEAMGCGGIGEGEDLGHLRNEGFCRGQLGDLVEPGALGAHGGRGDPDARGVRGRSQVVG